MFFCFNPDTFLIVAASCADSAIAVPYGGALNGDSGCITIAIDYFISFTTVAVAVDFIFLFIFLLTVAVLMALFGS